MENEHYTESELEQIFKSISYSDKEGVRDDSQGKTH